MRTQTIKTLRSLAIAVMGLVSIAPLVSAAPVAGRETRTGDIYISGLGSYQSTVAEYSALPRTRNSTANECGFFRLSADSTSAPIAANDTLKLNGGNNINVSGLPIEAVPRCTNGALAGNTTPAPVLKDSDGNVYFTGLTPYSSNAVTFLNVPTTRSARANTCGIVRLSNAGNFTVTAGSITLTDSDTDAVVLTIPDVATMTGVSGGPICRNGAAFTTSDWPTP